MYDTLDELVPEDKDGIKKAFVNVSGSDVRVVVPKESSSTLSDLYGLNPTIVAKLDKPFQLIPKQEENNIFTNSQDFNRTMLRNALRRIVDEV